MLLLERLKDAAVFVKLWVNGSRKAGAANVMVPVLRIRVVVNRIRQSLIGVGALIETRLFEIGAKLKTKFRLNVVFVGLAGLRVNRRIKTADAVFKGIEIWRQLIF